MSNGGYKGASPARETSPEQYPGVWELTEQFQAQADGNWPFQETDCAPKSLRFDESNSANLSRTFGVSGSRTTWTWSGWVKRGKLGGGKYSLFGGSGTNSMIRFNNDDGGDNLRVLDAASGGYDVITKRKFRDPSAWYSFVIAIDTTQSIAADRVKIFVNGVRETVFYGTPSYPTLNQSLTFNSNIAHTIGHAPGSVYFDGILSEIHFIDGQALSCEEFGFFDGQGIWQPKRFTGDYSSGPVYSNFGDTTYIQSSYPWSKAFDGIADGSYSNGAGAVDPSDWARWTPPNGIPVSQALRINTDNGTTSAVKVKFIGQPVQHLTSLSDGWNSVSGTGTLEYIEIYNSGTTWSYLCGVEIDSQVLIDASVGRNSFHLDFSDGVKDQSGLGNDWTGSNVAASGDGPASSPVWESGDSGWTIASGGGSASEGGSNGYQDVFTGLMEVGKVYAFTTSHTNGDQNGGWFFADSNSTSLSGTHPNQGRGSNSIGQRGRSSGHSDEDKAGAHGTFATANGVNAGDSNLSGFSVINPEGSDTINWVVDRVKNKVWVKRSTDSAWIQGGNPSDADSSPSFHLPATGDLYFGFVQYNNSNLTISIAAYSFTASGRASDIFVDSPVNGNEASTGAGSERRGNYATLNPLAKGSTLTLSNGNLDVTSSGNYGNSHSTIGVSSGKWYYEFTTSSSTVGVGITKSLSPEDPPGNYTGSYAYVTAGGNPYKQTGGSSSSYGSVPSSGDVIGVAFDLDAGTITTYLNGSSQGAMYSSNADISSGATFFAEIGDPTSSGNIDGSVNFGQRPFKHPVSGFSPLATSFLPEPSELAKGPTNAFDILLWSGQGSAGDRTIEGLDMESGPDMVWSKTRNHGYHHVIFDAVRGFSGAGNALTTDYIAGQANAGQIKSTDSTSVTWEKDSANGYVWYNESGKTYCSWCWDAGETTTTVPAGSLTTAAFNTSQHWSANHASGNTAPTAAFDGTGPKQNGYSHSSGSLTLTFSPALSGRFIVYGGSGGGGADDYTISDGATSTTLSSNQSYNSAPYFDVLDFGEQTGITTLTCSAGYTLYGVRVAGKLLVDSNVTPPNTPSIASTVRARPDAGFSIVKWDATSSAETIAHGLDKPKFIIMKSPDTYSSPYLIYHEDVGSSYYLDFGNGAASSNNLVYTNAPTSNVFSPGNGIVNTSSYGEMIAYCWSEVEGFSKFGSFENPSSSEGAFVFLNFKPALIIAKCVKNISSSSGAGDWMIYDTARSPFNNPADTNSLVVNVANSEDGYYAQTQASIDILSNGFKIRHPNSSPLGDPGRLYIYAAWSEHPFASNSRAR